MTIAFPTISCAERRSDVQVQRSRVILGRLQDSAGIDELWEKLSAGGQPSQCGWLKDKFGLSWQIVPSVLIEMLQDKDPAKSKRVMEAMLQMRKIDIEALRRAYRANGHSISSAAP